MFRYLTGSLARPVALSPSMGLRRLMTSTWFSRIQPSNSSTSATERPGRSSAATFTQSPGARVSFKRQGPRGSAIHVLEDLHAVGQHPALGLPVVGVGVAGLRHAGVSVECSAHLSLAPGSGTET